MKKLLKVIVVLVVLAAIVGVVVIINLDRIVKVGVEKGGSLILGVPVRVDNVSVSLTGGSIGLDGLTLGSPEGFSAKEMFKLGHAHVDVDLWSLRTEEMVVHEVVVDGAEITFEVYDETSGDLEYTYKDAAGWHFETVDSTGDVGKWTSLALHTGNMARISYRDETNEKLKYATRTGVNSWTIEDVDTSTGAGRYTSLVLDGSGYPHISYQLHDTGNFYDDLKYAYEDAGGWHNETLEHSGTFDTTEYGLHTAIALDTSGRPHISEYRLEGGVWGELRYVYWDGSSWQKVNGPVRTIGEFDGQYTSIALDDSDVPHISWYRLDVGLEYATYDGGSWDVTTVDSDGLGLGTSLVLDADGNPHISYRTSGDLMYAFYNGSSWTIQAADISDHCGYWSSIALDSDNWPHISYQGRYGTGYSDHELRYAIGVVPAPSSSLLALVALALGGAYTARRRKKNGADRQG